METPNTNFDFALEKRLASLNPVLSKRYSGCMFLFESMLKKYTACFPSFTDHTLLHSMNVVNYSNLLLGNIVDSMNEDEIYCYLMGVLIHDVGMGINDQNFEDFSEFFGIKEYRESHPDEKKADIIRSFHNDFSYAFTMKYYELLDIPDESYATAIALIGRGHRKVNLLDESLYPNDYKVSTGNIVHLPFLAGLIRVSDELDMGSDRNPDLLYDQLEEQVEAISKVSADHFKRHKSIDSITPYEDKIVFCINDKYPHVRELLIDCIKEVLGKLEYFVKVAKERPFAIPTQKCIEIDEGGKITILKVEA